MQATKNLTRRAIVLGNGATAVSAIAQLATQSRVMQKKLGENFIKPKVIVVGPQKDNWQGLAYHPSGASPIARTNTPFMPVIPKGVEGGEIFVDPSHFPHIDLKAFSESDPTILRQNYGKYLKACFETANEYLDIKVIDGKADIHPLTDSSQSPLRIEVPGQTAAINNDLNDHENFQNFYILATGQGPEFIPPQIRDFLSAQDNKPFFSSFSEIMQMDNQSLLDLASGDKSVFVLGTHLSGQDVMASFNNAGVDITQNIHWGSPSGSYNSVSQKVADEAKKTPFFPELKTAVADAIQSTTNSEIPDFINLFKVLLEKAPKDTEQAIRYKHELVAAFEAIPSQVHTDTPQQEALLQAYYKIFEDKTVKPVYVTHRSTVRETNREMIEDMRKADHFHTMGNYEITKNPDNTFTIEMNGKKVTVDHIVYAVGRDNSAKHSPLQSVLQKEVVAHNPISDNPSAKLAEVNDNLQILDAVSHQPLPLYVLTPGIIMPTLVMGRNGLPATSPDAVYSMTKIPGIIQHAIKGIFSE